MDYNFNQLNSESFEHLIQSLSRAILGDGLITFGDGRDGGREATFEGQAPFPGKDECWSGKWIIQAKFKNRNDNEERYPWVEKQFKNEMKKFEKIKEDDEDGLPDNYLFFTNVVLTPVSKTGGRDKIENLKTQYKDLIKNIHIIGYDDLRTHLETHRDIATSYASFILPGDVLMQLYGHLQKNNDSASNVHNLLGRFLEAEFLDDLQSRLDHAGDLTNEKIKLEKVFVDLYATKNGKPPEGFDEKRFLELCVDGGDHILRPGNEMLRYVLVGGPGYGKSTLTQFLCQVYRANFLDKLDPCSTRLPEVDSFLEDLKVIISSKPDCTRFPFRIILKNFAEWLEDRKSKEETHSLLLYLKHRIEKKGHGATIEVLDIEELLKTLSFAFVFDGLDEVPMSSNREEVLDEINKFIEIDLRRFNSDALIIATTRPQGYTREFDSSKYNHLTITDMNDEICLEYLERLLNKIDPVEDEREQHLKILKNGLDDHVVSHLMASPLQASIMAILVKSGGEPPRNKFALFTEYYNTISKRERQKNVSKILNEHPKYVEEIHYQLGFSLQLNAEKSSNTSATLSYKEFESSILKYLNSQGLKTDDANDKAAQIIQAALHRLVFLEEVEDGKFGFNIRSIQEYFAACYFVRNQPDQIVGERLRQICKSSYWRNAFLFAVGYIFKEKNYLIDTVESICRELNGSIAKPNEDTETSVCKLGSWLALDIVFEGILRGHPIYENKFVNLLEDLFKIPMESDHYLISSLPDDIIRDSVLPFTKKYVALGGVQTQTVAWFLGTFILNRKLNSPYKMKFLEFLINIGDILKMKSN